MKATQTLPPGYQERYNLNFVNNRAAVVALNLASLPLFVVFGWLFARLGRWLRPELWDGQLTVRFGLVELAGIAIALVLMVLLHEAAHGLFFWLFSGHVPIFGFKGAYAYAGAPGWFFGRNQYLLIALAPLLLLSFGGIALMPVLPLRAFAGLLVFLTMNAAGAVGDLFTVAKVASYPADTLVQDLGDGFSIFTPQDDKNNDF